MRTLLALLLLAPVAVAQTAAEKEATLKYIESLRDPATGAYKVTPDGKPSLRACNGATKAIHALGGELRDKDKVAKFVLSCYDEKAGTFADPGTKADVASTAIGVITACGLNIPHDKFKGAMDYLGKNAKEFEDVRLSAAAVEAWGVKNCPFKLDVWLEVAEAHLKAAFMATGKSEVRNGGTARDIGGATALKLRLGAVEQRKADAFTNGDFTAALLLRGQRPDGGWGKKGAKTSNIETTYRVMRALLLLKVPTVLDVEKLREFIASHRNKDGGYATEPGKPSSMSGVYYNTIIAKWLDDMGKK